MMERYPIPFIIKKIIKAVFRIIGLEIHRISNQDSINVKLDTNHLWLKSLNIRTVFDIGAHKGEFVDKIHRILSQAKIYAFEPLEDCFRELNMRMKNIKNFRAFNIALGDISGETQFWRNAYSPSSSLLPMQKLHKENFPYTSKESKERVKIARLDDVAKDLDIEDNILIKIDVQGAEDKVIKGGMNTIRRAKLLIIETSFQELYEGQPLFDDIYDLLRAEGFRYIGNPWGYLASPVDGSFLQTDSFFIKEGANR